MADQWASISELSARYDERVLGELASDTDTAASVSGNAKIVACLEDATAIVKSAVHQGKAYTESQMSTIASGGNPLLIRLVCDIAVHKLHARRMRDIPNVVQSSYDESMDLLDELRKGMRVFDETQNSGAQTAEPYAQPVAKRPTNLPISTSALYPSQRLPA